MSLTTPSTITLEGREYDIEKFSGKVKHMVGIHTFWKNQLAEQNLEVSKTQAALKALELELAALVKQEADSFPESD